MPRLVPRSAADPSSTKSCVTKYGSSSQSNSLRAASPRRWMPGSAGGTKNSPPRSLPAAGWG